MKILEHKKIKGAISIFLVMILIPTMLFSAVLIDASRMASARAMTQEAADLAAASALASYNLDLKEDFGLFAIDDSSQIESIYHESLMATLMAYGLPGDGDYSNQVWDILKSQAGFGNPYNGQSFLNLYDFSIDSCTVTPLYSLANWQVLENQMVEQAKFRGLYVIGDRFNLIGEIGNLKAAAEKNRESADVMEDKMQVDEDNVKVEQVLEQLRSAAEKLEQAVNETKACQNAYLECLAAKMKETRLNNTESNETMNHTEEKLAKDYSSSRSKLKKQLDGLNEKARNVSDLAAEAEQETEEAIRRLENFRDGNGAKSTSNEAVKEMIMDADKSSKQYKEIYIPVLQKIQNDDVLQQMIADTGLGTNMDELADEIEEAMGRYEDELTQMEKESQEDNDEDEEEEKPTEYYFYYLNSNDSTKDGDAVLNGSSVRCYGKAVRQLTAYFARYNQWSIWKEFNPVKSSALDHYKGNLNKNFAKKKSSDVTSSDNRAQGAPKGEISSSVYQALPSRSFHAPKGSNAAGAGFYNEKGDLSVSKNILSKGKNSMILDIAEAARDDVLCLSYMVGTFKTRMTGVEQFSKEGMPEAKKSDYMPEWRYAYSGGEMDMRFTPKKDRDTVLRSEIEYIIYGKQSDGENEAAVYAAIFTERLANNMVAVYLNRQINEICHAAAGAACLATVNTIPEPVFFWIFLTAWAVAETVIEMGYLVNDGYRIPLIKTQSNLLLRTDADLNGSGGLIGNYGGTNRSVFVSYEDYLLIMMLIEGRNQRLMRSADIIEINMKKKAPDFAMDQAFTYLRANTDLSVRYLFGSTNPFQVEYEQAGVTGRMKFNHTIYQGY